MVAGAWTFGWQALVAIGTLGLALFAAIQLRAFNRSERRRTQPVAVANAVGAQELDRFRIFLTNHGTGTAFNVRFGVRLDGHEYAVGGGTRYTVGPNERLPREDYLDLQVPITAYADSPKGPGIYERRVYWARYENAFGQVWETANPADPLADFDVFPASAWRRSLVEHRRRLWHWLKSGFWRLWHWLKSGFWRLWQRFWRL